MAHISVTVVGGPIRGPPVLRHGERLVLPNDPNRLRLVQRADVVTTLTRLGGGVAFDGRIIHLTRFALTIDEVSVVADGTLALVVRNPGIDLRLSGNADVTGVARWVTSEPHAMGAIAFDATLAGPFAAPVVVARIQCDALSWQRLDVTAGNSAFRVDSAQFDVSVFEPSFAGGRVTGAGRVGFYTGETALTASWSDSFDGFYLV